VTREASHAAIRAALAPGVAVDLAGAPPDLLVDIVELVASGKCSPAEAAEAVTLAVELGGAVDRGELAESQGDEVLRRLADRHNLGDRGAD
jgi:hypothetical protein